MYMSRNFDHALYAARMREAEQKAIELARQNEELSYDIEIEISQAIYNIRLNRI